MPEHVPGWMVIQMRGGGDRDSTSVECLFSNPPPPGRVLLNEGVPGITGWPVSMAAAPKAIIGKERSQKSDRGLPYVLAPGGIYVWQMPSLFGKCRNLSPAGCQNRGEIK
jgi:hypothetical protein